MKNGEGIHQDGSRSDCPEPRCQSVQAIHEIHGVHNRHRKQRGQDGGLDLIQNERGAPADRQAHQIPGQTHEAHHHCPAQLPTELEHPGNVVEIINHAHHHDDECGCYHRSHIRGDRWESAGQRWQLAGGDDGQDHAREHRHPAKPRGGNLVHIAVARNVDLPEAHHDAAHDTRGQVRGRATHEQHQG